MLQLYTINLILYVSQNIDISWTKLDMESNITLKTAEHLMEVLSRSVCVSGCWVRDVATLRFLMTTVITSAWGEEGRGARTGEKRRLIRFLSYTLIVSYKPVTCRLCNNFRFVDHFK